MDSKTIEEPRFTDQELKKVERLQSDPSSEYYYNDPDESFMSKLKKKLEPYQEDFKGFIEYLFTPSRHFGTGQYSEGGLETQTENAFGKALSKRPGLRSFSEAKGQVSSEELKAGIDNAATYLLPFYESGINISNVVEEYMKPESERDYDYIKQQFNEAGQGAAIEAGMILLGGVVFKYGGQGIKALYNKVKQYEVNPDAVSAFGVGAIRKKDTFEEVMTPVKATRKKVEQSGAGVLRPSADLASDLDPRLKRAMSADTAGSIMPGPGKFFNPSKPGYKGDNFVGKLKNADIELDLEFGNYIMMGQGKPKDVSNETFENLFISARPSEKKTSTSKAFDIEKQRKIKPGEANPNIQNKAVARANLYNGPSLSIEDMKANYLRNTNKPGVEVRTNLLQPGQFSMVTDEGKRALDHPIVAVQNMGGSNKKHFYTLDAQFVGPVRMDRLTKTDKKTGKVPQPNLRPVTVGDVQLGEQIGTIRISTKVTDKNPKGYNDHPLYDYIEVDASKSAPEDMGLIPKFNEGGLAEEKQTPPSWLQRALDPTTPTTENEESIRTTSVDGKLFPTIRMIEGKLVKLSLEEAYKMAIEKGDFIQFKSDEEADAFSQRLSNIISSKRKQQPKEMYEGGVAMNDQMEMAFMQQGGIKDDGMNKDPVSGNPIPPGSMATEVRDDIPAMLSEGEYVVPADVLRYYGVNFFENLRGQAKQGLQTMETNGRIGGEPMSSQQVQQNMSGQPMAGAPAVQPIAANAGVITTATPDLTNYTQQAQQLGGGQPFNAANYTTVGGTLFEPEKPKSITLTKTFVNAENSSDVRVITYVNGTVQPPSDVQYTQPPYYLQGSSGLIDAIAAFEATQNTGGGGGGEDPKDPKPVQPFGSGVDWTDPLAYAKQLADPSTAQKLLKAGTLGAAVLGGPAGFLLAGVGSTALGLQQVSALEASKILAEAQGMDTTEIDKILETVKSSQNLAGQGLDSILATGVNNAKSVLDRLNMRYTEKDGKLIFSDEDKKYNNLQDREDAIDKQLSDNKGVASTALENIQSGGGNNPSGTTIQDILDKSGEEGSENRELTEKQLADVIEGLESGAQTGTIQLNKGGLMSKGKKKK